jgi:hypothetical protein
MSAFWSILGNPLPPCRRGLGWGVENLGLQPFPVPSSFVARRLPPLLRGGVFREARRNKKRCE